MALALRSTGMVAAKQRGSTLARDRTNSMNLSKRDLRRFDELAHSNPDVEFLYLRENEFEQFDVYLQLPKLKVLDLSINSLRGDLASIAACAPALRHLYLTGNRLTSLEGAMKLPNLETLCVSENLLESFDGLDTLPSLRVLSLNYNSIATFRGFPYLPSLYALNVYGNPIAEAAAYRAMAVSVAPSIETLDKLPVTEEERTQATYYLGKIAVCLTEGMVIVGDQAEEQAEQFLLDMQRETYKDRSLQVQVVSLHAAAPGVNQIVEGQPVELSVCLQDARPPTQAAAGAFHSRTIFPVRFRLLGEATEVLVVGAVNRWKDPVPMQRSVSAGGDVSFETTLYLPAGEYEYRYMVDGVERVLEDHRVESKFGQGPCNICRVDDATSGADDRDSDSILHIRWLRSNEANGFDVIEGENALFYTPTTADVGFCLRAEVLVYEGGQFSFLYFDVSTQVQPGMPVCKKLALNGSAAEGEELTAEIEYAGGVEGASIVQWFRVEADGTETLVSVSGNLVEVYACTLDDVGHRIRLEYTPVRADNEAGEKVSLLSEVVSSGVPSAQSMEIRGAAVEGEQLMAVVQYAGGIEGPSTWQWHRLEATEAGEEFVPVAGQRSNVYTIQTHDVGCRLAVEYTPISVDGIRGETCRCTMEHPIAAAAPIVSNVAVTGALEEGHAVLVDFDYFGGRPGTHLIQWYSRESLPAPPAAGTARKHQDPLAVHAGRVPFGRANSKSQTLSIAEVGRFLEVELTPIREDGTRGDAVRARTMDRVMAAPPTLKSLKIAVTGSGSPTADNAVPAGSTLEAVEEYVGGEQGASAATWERSTDEQGAFEPAGHGRRYVVTGVDAGRTLRLTYVPVRRDGVSGEPLVRIVNVAFSQTPQPAVAQSPLEEAAVPVETHEQQ